MMASNPFVYSHWNWYFSNARSSDLGTLNSLITPCELSNLESALTKSTISFPVKISHNTLKASCIKRTAISMPKSSPAILVNLVMMVHALNTARKSNNRPVQMQTLYNIGTLLRNTNHICQIQNSIKTINNPDRVEKEFHTTQPKLNTACSPTLAVLCWSCTNKCTL